MGIGCEVEVVGPRVVYGTTASTERDKGESRNSDSEHGDEARGEEAGGSRVRGLRNLRASAVDAVARRIKVGVECHERGHEKSEGGYVCTAQVQDG